MATALIKSAGLLQKVSGIYSVMEAKRKDAAMKKKYKWKHALPHFSRGTTTAISIIAEGINGAPPRRW